MYSFIGHMLRCIFLLVKCSAVFFCWSNVQMYLLIGQMFRSIFKLVKCSDVFVLIGQMFRFLYRSNVQINLFIGQMFKSIFYFICQTFICIFSLVKCSRVFIIGQMFRCIFYSSSVQRYSLFVKCSDVWWEDGGSRGASTGLGGREGDVQDADRSVNRPTSAWDVNLEDVNLEEVNLEDVNLEEVVNCPVNWDQSQPGWFGSIFVSCFEIFSIPTTYSTCDIGFSNLAEFGIKVY